MGYIGTRDLGHGQRRLGALATMGFSLSMLPPIALIVAGAIIEGPEAIDWTAAVIWGVIGTVVFTVFGMMGKAMGMTRMDILQLLGSSVAPPGSTGAKIAGAIIHHANGAILAIAWAFGAALFGVPADWRWGLGWGAILWALALLMFSTVGAVHPAIRRGEEPDPGPAGIRLGKMTPIGSLMGHLVYGAILGLGYAAFARPG